MIKIIIMKKEILKDKITAVVEAIGNISVDNVLVQELLAQAAEELNKAVNIIDKPKTKKTRKRRKGLNAGRSRSKNALRKMFEGEFSMPESWIKLGWNSDSVKHTMFNGWLESPIAKIAK